MESIGKLNPSFITFILSAVSRQIANFALTCFCLVSFGIVWRFLRIKLGARIQPDRTKAILITGATSGIGLTIAKHFYALGFSVIAGYYNDQEPGYAELLHYGNEPYQNVCKRKMLNSPDPKLLLVKMDVRCKESIENSAKEVHKFLKTNDIKLYCLVNNAGTSKDGPFEWCCQKAFCDLIDTNLKGTMMVTRRFIMDIISNKGRIVNVSSGVSLTPLPSISVYGSCKSAVSYFSASVHNDIKHYGAASVCVLPGNLITNSNIIYPRVRCLQESEMKLSDDERRLYKRSIEVYRSLLNRSLMNKLETSGDDMEQVAKLHGITIPEHTKPRRNMNKNRWLYQWFIGKLDGRPGSGESLEHSGISESFEDAILLVEPPQSLYAGNFVYTYLTGPSLEYWPRVMYDFLTRLSLGSLLAR